MNKELLTELCGIDGVSGHEDTVRRYIRETLEKSNIPMEMHQDPMGNLLVHVIGKEPAKHVVQFDAHMDEVGLIITYICEDGSLRFDTVGGIDSQVLFGSRVRIGDVHGVIAGKAIHMCRGDDKKKVPEKEAMVIDIGVSSAEEAKALVHLGDVATFDNGLMWFNDNLFCGKAVDDRLGCALLIELAKEQPERDIWITFSVQEEVGLRGAGAASKFIRPEYAVAIDATTAADTVGNSGEATVCRQGKGAVVSFADRATLYDPDLYGRIRTLAEKNDIPAQTKSRVAGGNNAGAMQQTNHGVRMAAVSLPCRYIHSPACVGRVEDADAMLRLLKLLAEELTK